MSALPTQILNPIVEPVKALMRDGFELPHGIRNGNPANLHLNPRVIFRGQFGKDTTGEMIFDTPTHGIRALGVTVGFYMDAVPGLSLGKCLSFLYSEPPISNGSFRYYLSTRLLFDIGRPFPFDKRGWELARAIIEYRNARPWKGQMVRTFYEDEFIKRAIHLSHVI